MLLKRTASEILRDAAKLIARNTKITNFNPGSIARSIVESMKDEFPSLYDFMEEVLNQGYVSRANDEYLDMIGALLNCERRTHQVFDAETNELLTQKLSDDDYRYEITQQVLKMASSNEMAVRLSVLAVDGVRDIIPREYSHGTGSFSFILVVDHGYNEIDVRDNAMAAILESKGFGIRPHIILPHPVELDVRIQLFFHETADAIQKEYAKSVLAKELEIYLGNFTLGQQFIYNDFAHQIMSSHNKIIDFEIVRFSLHGHPALLTNHQVLEDERIIPNLIEIL